MNADLRRGIGQRLAEEGERIEIVHARSLSGGSIHRVWAVELQDGRRFAVKSGPTSTQEMFECEAEGLIALRQAGTIRVPTGVELGETDHYAFLIMEAIQTGRKKTGFFSRFGEQFAQMHQAAQNEHCGFSRDNYIGSTPQPNAWKDDWCGFWREHRLGFQLDLARSQGFSSPELNRLGDRLLDRLETWLDLDEPFCLLHGDLWSENFLVDESGNAVLIDPAAYYGHREADLAMTQLFGGFGASFYQAYDSTWPLPPGSEERLSIYRLYHLLNHLNLFGGGYLGSCLDILRRLA